MKWIAVLCVLAACQPKEQEATKPVGEQPATPIAPQPSAEAELAAEARSKEVVYGKLPATLEVGRFFLTATTDSGKKIRFATDSGGGLVMGFASASRLELPTLILSADGETIPAVALPSVTPKIPGIVLTKNLVPVFKGGELPKEMESEFDVLLGQVWFRERIWTLDYLSGEMTLHEAAPAATCGKTTALHFRKDENGEQTHHYPRVDVEIDGVILPFLFDTGATTMLSAEAISAIDDGKPGIRATSFIRATVAMKWKKAHPTWRWIDKGENGTGAAMIEVPSLKIAGNTVGPVWFTMRSDGTYKRMSELTDVQIDGAIGGSALQYFRIVADYPRSLAEFCTK